MKNLKFHMAMLAGLGALLLTFLAATEFILWWSFHGESAESRDHVVRTDYLPVKFRGNYQGRIWGIDFSTNRFGFRDEPDFPTQPEPDEIRVFSLGDSIGFGVGVEAAEHYSQIAERVVANTLPGYKLNLVNASGQGYSPSGYHAYLLNEGFGLHPSMIILEIELCNDLTDEALLHREYGPDGSPTSVLGGRYVVSWDGNLLGTYALRGTGIERTYTYTVFLRRVLNLLNRVSTPPLFHEEPGGDIYYSLGFDQFLLDENRVERGWDNLLEALEGIQTLAASYDSRFLVMVMPSRHIFGNSPPRRKLAASLLRRAETEIAARSIPYLNMESSIEAAGGSSLFFDFAHLTVDGNAAVGKRLGAYLREMIASGLLRSRIGTPGARPSEEKIATDDSQ